MYTTLDSEADMNLYEVYLINTFKPKFNVLDKTNDGLCVELTELDFLEFPIGILEGWKEEIRQKDMEFNSTVENQKRKQLVLKNSYKTIPKDILPQWLAQHSQILNYDAKKETW